MCTDSDTDIDPCSVRLTALIMSTYMHFSPLHVCYKSNGFFKTVFFFFFTCIQTGCVIIAQNLMFYEAYKAFYSNHYKINFS